MSTYIEINGKALIPLKEAAKKIAYSRDYLAKLARDQKIVATQVGRQWFVDMISLQAFLDEATLEQEVRNQHLREERRRELLAKKNLEKLAIDIASAQIASPAKSFLVATMVLFLGLFTGVMLNSSNGLIASLGDKFPSSTFMAQVINENVVTTADEKELTLFTEINEYPLFVDEAEVDSMKSFENGIILFTEGEEIKNKEQIQNLFSDNVQVELSEHGQGVVTYVGKEGEISQFPFITIPENKSVSKPPNEIEL
ncbi:MAG: helix-turn-helix domain-containing protein [Candidatus Pacebacteria bacterium]|nr:helix-turn-helix domain-containing protein [Candidatus Paceibacterota bacterium]